MRTNISREIADPMAFRQQLLSWGSRFREVVLLDSNRYPQAYASFDCVLAVDALTSLKTDYKNAFDDLHQYQSRTNDWLFGYLSYDLKNDTEDLQSANFDGLGFADLFFFQPKKLFFLKGNQLEMSYLHMCEDEMQSDFEEIGFSRLPLDINLPVAEIKPRITREDYIAKANEMCAHIRRGDIYEANFCQEFYAENARIDPVTTYQQLNTVSRPPFAAYLKDNEHYLLCASPERYLRKQGSKVISQPIKGTSKRFADAESDEKSKKELSENAKERSENIMIVDLVRNDLSRTAAKGSVNVEELCGVYSFAQVHQLISTVVSEVDPGIPPVEIIRTTFPMGSMTGAPKISAMQIIEKLEATRRGLYSGAVGYFTPQGDFDFNVVIRSILYNAQNRYLSFSVGSAITALAVPESEYEECLLKAKAMFGVLQRQ